jgi:hypothetical protein
MPYTGDEANKKNQLLASSLMSKLEFRTRSCSKKECDSLLEA